MSEKQQLLPPKTRDEKNWDRFCGIIDLMYPNYAVPYKMLIRLQQQTTTFKEFLKSVKKHQYDSLRWGSHLFGLDIYRLKIHCYNHMDDWK